MNTQNTSDDFFLPNFCTGRNTLVVVVIAELVALMLALGRNQPGLAFWQHLGMVSLFLQWLALSSAAIVCLLRRRLASLPERHAALLSYLLLVATTLALSEAAWQVGQWGGTTQALFPLDHAGFLIRNTLVSAIVSMIVLRYFYVQHQWKRNLERESHARIDALQARIRPHFLFNSMNTIAALIRNNPQAAEQAVEDLADLFRASLSDARTLVTLQEEIAITKLYERIEQLRLASRLRVTWELGDLPLQMPVPLLILQPLLENAIYHGIEPQPQGGAIRITGTVEKDVLRITVHNPLPAAPYRRHSGNQLALNNIRQRLLLAFHGRAVLHAGQDNDEYIAQLELPIGEQQA